MYAEFDFRQSLSPNSDHTFDSEIVNSKITCPYRCQSDLYIELDNFILFNLNLESQNLLNRMGQSQVEFIEHEFWCMILLDDS